MAFTDKAARLFLEQAVARNGDLAITDVSPLAVAVYVSQMVSPRDQLVTNCVTFDVQMNPILRARAIRATLAGGFPVTKKIRGVSGQDETPAYMYFNFGWDEGRGTRNWRTFASLVQTAVPGSIWGKDDATAVSGNLGAYGENDVYMTLHRQNNNRGRALLEALTQHGQAQLIPRLTSVISPDTPGILAVSIEDTTDAAHLTVWGRDEVLNPESWKTMNDDGEEVPWDGPKIRVNNRPVGKATVQNLGPYTGAEAAPVISEMVRRGIPVFDALHGDGLATLLRTASKSVAIWPMPGRPAQAVAAVGRSAGLDGVAAPANGAVAQVVHLTAGDVQLAAETLTTEQLVVHPIVKGVADLATALPHEDERLRPYQRELVGQHLNSTLGYVNAAEPGMGKTIMTWVAINEEAKLLTRPRFLVLVEPGTIPQWVSEAETWAPDVRVVLLRKEKDLAEVKRLHDTHTGPLAIIGSYHLASLAAVLETDQLEAIHAAAENTVEVEIGAAIPMFTEDLTPAIAAEIPPGIGAFLMSVNWAGLVADEAKGLRGTGTKIVNGLWMLGGKSARRVALTGTPVRKGLDDIGRLLSWVLGDANLFHGKRLDVQFDLTKEEDVVEFTQAIGPLVFRRDKSEIVDELPQVAHETVTVSPTQWESTLVENMHAVAREAYEDLVAAVERRALRGDDVSREEGLALAEELRAAHMRVVGTVNLLRIAAADPEALLHSKAEVAAALRLNGDFNALGGQPGTKRQWGLDYVSEAVALGERVIVFTEFSTIARNLIADYERAGLLVGSFMGGASDRVRSETLRAFREGELDVLVCTSAAERGLNLQAASLMIHFDLPWTADGIVQRTGRMERIGSEHSEVKVVFPVVEDTIEERIAARAVNRAMTSILALDAHRGVDVTQTDMGRAVAGLAFAPTSSVKNAGDSEMIRLAREMFGTDDDALVEMAAA